jgi:hypothetical protein
VRRSGSGGRDGGVWRIKGDGRRRPGDGVVGPDFSLAEHPPMSPLLRSLSKTNVMHYPLSTRDYIYEVHHDVTVASIHLVPLKVTLGPYQRFNFHSLSCQPTGLGFNRFSEKRQDKVQCVYDFVEYIKSTGLTARVSLSQ